MRSRISLVKLLLLLHIETLWYYNRQKYSKYNEIVISLNNGQFVEFFPQRQKSKNNLFSYETSISDTYLKTFRNFFENILFLRGSEKLSKIDLSASSCRYFYK